MPESATAVPFRVSWLLMLRVQIIPLSLFHHCKNNDTKQTNNEHCAKCFFFVFIYLARHDMVMTKEHGKTSNSISTEPWRLVFFSISINIIFKHSTHYLFSNWRKAHNEFSKSAPVRSSSSRLFKNWFKLSKRISSYGCTREVWRARRKSKSCSRR